MLPNYRAIFFVDRVALVFQPYGAGTLNRNGRALPISVASPAGRIGSSRSFRPGARRGEGERERNVRSDRALPVLRAGQRIPAHVPAIQQKIYLPVLWACGAAGGAVCEVFMCEVPRDDPHREPLQKSGRVAEAPGGGSSVFKLNSIQVQIISSPDYSNLEYPDPGYPRRGLLRAAGGTIIPDIFGPARSTPECLWAKRQPFRDRFASRLRASRMRCW